MKQKMKMRLVTNKERNVIQEYLLQFEVDINQLEGKLMRIGKKVFLVDEKVFEMAVRIEKEIKAAPYCLGVEMGTLSRGFEPSIELAEVISEFTDVKTVITEEGEKLFSYGRDVFVQNIVKGKVEGERIVVNEENEVLGIGFFDSEMLKNVIDKGFYLRGKKGRIR